VAGRVGDFHSSSCPAVLKRYAMPKPAAYICEILGDTKTHSRLLAQNRFYAQAIRSIEEG